MLAEMLLALIQASAALPEPPPLTKWGDLPRLEQIRASNLTPDDTRAIMEIIRENPECESSVGPMQSPPDRPNMHMVGLSVGVIVLAPPRGDFLRIIAAPGPCDPLRNYARALINARYRRAIRRPQEPGPAWYQTRIGFSWEP